MPSGFRQWFAERAELIVLGITLLTTASLLVWWTILLRGQMYNNEMLERQLLATQVLSAPQRDERTHARVSTEEEAMHLRDACLVARR